MTSIVLTGNCQDKEFIKAEMIALYLNKNLPDFKCEIISKLQPEFYTRHHWNTRMARDKSIKTMQDLPQMIFYKSGELIGNSSDFIKWVKLQFNFTMEFDNDLLEEIVKES